MQSISADVTDIGDSRPVLATLVAIRASNCAVKRKRRRRNFAEDATRLCNGEANCRESGDASRRVRENVEGVLGIQPLFGPVSVVNNVESGLCEDDGEVDEFCEPESS